MNDEKTVKNKKKGNKKNKNIRTYVVIGVEAAILVALIVVIVYVFRATGEKTGVQKIRLPEGEVAQASLVPDNTEIPEVDDEINENYTTLALFGVDARGKNLDKGTRTDTIIICSINNETGEARLCSVYRDTLLNVAGPDKNPSYQKCNAAYAYDGPAGALHMLNNNLDLYITRFITIGFQGVMSTVDAVGGVDINLTSSEIKYLNDYQASMYSTETNTVITDDYVPVTEAGLQTLSGYQALAYCRIRYTAGSDFKRTERQRDVVSQIITKARKMDPVKVTKICNDVFPLVATNLDLNDDIIPMASEVNKYEIVDSTGFPFDDKITTGLLGPKGDCVIPVDLESNVIELHKYLYPTEEYTPSETVIKTSNDIKAEAAKYGK
ncbi:MAG: LCP family protein [Lachnospiraceae bacterium]|nr:LCP family protein [Lachnospiraceae bacterium]